MFVSSAHAQAAGASGGGDFFVSLMPLILIFAVFYFLLIRPQQRKVKEHRAMIENIKRGDQVLTAGGIVGKVTRIEDNMLTVEIAKEVQVKVARGTISEVINKPQPGPANDTTAPGTPASGGGGFLGKLFKK